MTSNHANAGAVAGDGAAGDSKPVVCFLGPVTSYTHQATLSAFPAEKFDLMPVRTIKDIFETTQSGRAAYGVVPFENSTNGSVVFTLDCFADRAGAYPDLAVCAEIYLDVHHCLVGRRLPRRKRGGSNPNPPSGPEPPQLISPSEADEEKEDLAASIRRIYSHPQAFGQCTRFLGARLRGVETVDVSSTSRAAEIVREESSSSSPTSSFPPPGIFEAAAVSSAAAAEMLGLDVLARNIEDRADNTTRFFVLRRRGGAGAGAGAGVGGETDAQVQGEVDGVDIESLLVRTRRRGPAGAGATTTAAAPPPPPPPPPMSTTATTTTSSSSPTTTTKSLVSFTVPHRSPGALADVLDCFRRSGLNLTSISSRPSLMEDDHYDDHQPSSSSSPSPSFQYIFFVEFEGHRFRDPEGRVRDALAGVAAAARRWRWLGSWENMLASSSSSSS
ncbi:prephenate dehydratase [Diatrype stigma]|uniref:Prephenate dehydratase n=1 Tax=Diatrype stigma TaxID=117547 RepID=A0AAN9YRQ0_9PEZI